MTSYHEWGRAMRAFTEAYLADPAGDWPRQQVRVSWRSIEPLPTKERLMAVLLATIRALARAGVGDDVGTTVILRPTDDSTEPLVRFPVEDGALAGYTKETVGTAVGDLPTGCLVVELEDRLLRPIGPPP
jgi:hypothetical protein